jgi:hypothetical protein
MRPVVTVCAALFVLSAAHGEDLVLVGDDVSTVFGRARVVADVASLAYAPYSDVPRMTVFFMGEFGEARDTAVVEGCARGVGRMRYRLDLGRHERVTYFWARQGHRAEDAVARVVCAAHEARQRTSSPAPRRGAS